MINPNVVKAVQELLTDRGIEQKDGEQLPDYVARGLGLSHTEASAFLERVHDGESVEAAQAELGIKVDEPGQSLLSDIARAIGSALGRMSR